MELPVAQPFPTYPLNLGQEHLTSESRMVMMPPSSIAPSSSSSSSFFGMEGMREEQDARYASLAAIGMPPLPSRNQQQRVGPHIPVPRALPPPTSRPRFQQCLPNEEEEKRQEEEEAFSRKESLEDAVSEAITSSSSTPPYMNKQQKPKRLRSAAEPRRGSRSLPSPFNSSDNSTECPPFPSSTSKFVSPLSVEPRQKHLARRKISPAFAESFPESMVVPSSSNSHLYIVEDSGPLSKLDLLFPSFQPSSSLSFSLSLSMNKPAEKPRNQPQPQQQQQPQSQSPSEDEGEEEEDESVEAEEEQEQVQKFSFSVAKKPSKNDPVFSPSIGEDAFSSSPSSESDILPSSLSVNERFDRIQRLVEGTLF